MSSTRPRSRTPTAARVRKHREGLRAAGLRPVQIWVPDVRSKRFAAQARRQSRAIAQSAQEQDDRFDELLSVTFCPFTTNPTPAPLFRVPVKPSERNGLKEGSSLMVDKITTVARGKVGKRIGRLEDEDIVRLNRAIVVFLGLGGTSPES